MPLVGAACLQVMDFVVNTERHKVAVHCHAGLGRTGGLLWSKVFLLKVKATLI